MVTTHREYIMDHCLIPGIFMEFAYESIVIHEKFHKGIYLYIHIVSHKIGHYIKPSLIPYFTCLHLVEPVTMWMIPEHIRNLRQFYIILTIEQHSKVRNLSIYNIFE